VIGGAGAALSVLVVAVLRERSLAEREVPSWALDPPRAALERDWESVVAELAAAACLAAAPRLRFIEGEVPNAFSLGDLDGEGAFIMVTEAALVCLTPREMLAVLAHEVAHIEAGDLRAVALADSIQATVADLSGFKGRYLWGPRLILRRSLPVFACLAALWPIIRLASQPAWEGPVGFVFFVIAAIVYYGWTELGWSRPITRVAKRAWIAIFQFALWLGMFGLLTLVEALLAWPTVFTLSRLLSRSRVFAADRRAVELTSDPGGLRDALETLASVEREPAEERFDRLRFSLFVTPRARSRYRSLVERIAGTHPSASRRIGRLSQSPPRKFATDSPTVQDIPSVGWNNRAR
jgi:Zn-dependent protease with chaperone function